MLLIGAAGSLLAAIIQAFAETSRFPVVIFLMVALICVMLLLGIFVQRLRDLRVLGIKRWESSMAVGTTTEECMKHSHRHLAFLGIAATKWTRDETRLCDMLRHHASRGGGARFLLLDPDSPACQEFNSIKQNNDTSLADIIRDSVRRLIQLRDNHHLPIEVKYYSSQPIFRITILDESTIIVGLYSHSSSTGQDTPQLFFEHGSSEWSYYYAFNALFASMWRTAASANDNCESSSEGLK